VHGWIDWRRVKGQPRQVLLAFLKVPALAAKRLLPEVKQDMGFLNGAAFYKTNCLPH
jgi:hypothetical protein